MNTPDSISRKMPQYPESLWRATTPLPSFPPLAENIEVDIAIVGAGITGITTAYLLSTAGHKVALLEAGRILEGTTGHTTAKITSQHDMIYDELLNHFGKEKASMYYHANAEAAQFIKDTSAKLNIDCELKSQDAYLYMDQDTNLSKLEKEMEAYRELGIPGEWVNKLPISLPIKAAIRMRDQAQFHPLKYLTRLVEGIVQAGGKLFEHTTIEKLEKVGPFTLSTYKHGHKIRCNHVVSAAHFPFYDGGGLYFTRLHAQRSYVVAMKPSSPFAGGMYLSADEPKRSLRSASWDGEEVVLVGGESHKTGQGICTHQYYERLEDFGSRIIGNHGIPFRWSAQDLVTLDKVPYIGQLTASDAGIYVATGYNKWGMTSGTLAGRLITDQIQGKDNPYTSLFTPSRFKADPSLKHFVTENVNVAKELISGKMEMVHRKADQLQHDEGSVVVHDGKRAGAYRDAEGKLFLVDTTCTHLGCETAWNEAERTWDCPCHGSRYNFDGSVIEGPATDPLGKLKLDE